jgi:hypothetical protein
MPPVISGHSKSLGDRVASCAEVEVLVNSAVDGSSFTSPGLAQDLLLARAGLNDRVQDIVRSRSLQAEIAARSYFHPNGFVKLVLEQHPGGGQLRLHVWPGRPKAEDIHGHGWSYASVVVGGAVCEVPFTEVDPGVGTPMWRSTYAGVGHRRFAMADPVPMWVLQSGPERVLRAGEISGGGPQHVHRFFAVEAPAATMLRVGPVVHRQSNVYREDAVPPQIVRPRPTTRADVAEWLTVVGEMVAAAGG